MKKIGRLLKKYAPVAASLCLSGAIAFTAVKLRGALAGGRVTEIVTIQKTQALPLYAAARYFAPSGGEVISPFSAEAPVWNQTLSIFEVHEGEDYFCPDGQVMCAADGKVEEVFFSERLGLTVCVSHGEGEETVYASLSEALVKKGQSVRAGQVIALSGESARAEKEAGAHVHFEYRKNGVSSRCPFAFDEDS